MSYGMNVSRRVVGGMALGSNGADSREQMHQAAPPVLQRAVVMDVIYDPMVLSEEELDQIRRTVNNYELVDVMPVNSVIAKIVSDAGGLSATPHTILFPFYSSHMMLPIAPGEQIHVIYQDFQARGSKIGFWMSRIHGSRTVEDANYTHLDRRFEPLNNLAFWTTDDIKNIESSPPPSFPNGGGTDQTRTVSLVDGREDPFADILVSSSAAKLITPEPVPRWNKRPQEFVIQASNNALICLGEDRSGPVSGALVQGDNPPIDQKGFSGTIDMVVGRGRIFPESIDDDPILTAPRTILNTRGTVETDKAPFRNADPAGGRKQGNPNEGNPDFVNDASRLYVSMQTRGDEKFGLTDLTFNENTLPFGQPTNAADEGTLNRAYFAGKSDHIRMIARSDPDREIDGTIMIIREGAVTGSRDLAYIQVTRHGIQIDAQKIYLGPGAMVNPDDDENIDFNSDENGYEPYILWSKYNDTVVSLQKQIKDLDEKHSESIKALRDNVKSILSGMENAFSANACVPYSQNPAITAAKAAIAAGKATLDAPVDQPLTSVNESIGTDQTDNIDENVKRENHSQKVYGSKGEDA